MITYITCYYITFLNYYTLQFFLVIVILHYCYIILYYFLNYNIESKIHSLLILIKILTFRNNFYRNRNFLEMCHVVKNRNSVNFKSDIYILIISLIFSCYMTNRNF